MDGLTQSVSFLDQSKFYIVGGLTEHEIISKAIAEEGLIIFGPPRILPRAQVAVEYCERFAVGKDPVTTYLCLPQLTYELVVKRTICKLRRQGGNHAGI